MAENILYGNVNEFPFPFELVVPELTWLPTYLANAEPSTVDNIDKWWEKYYNFRLMLNTILVWAGARTATLENTLLVQKVKPLILKLNAVLATSASTGRKQKLVLVPRGLNVFITRENNPRFNWDSRPTQLQIGRNLDYSAAGHMFSPPYPPRGSMDMIERTTNLQLYGECFLLDSLMDESARVEFQRFNDTK